MADSKGTTLEKLSEEMVFALDICEQAAIVAMKYFNSGVDTITKADGSPVTAADQRVRALDSRRPSQEIS